MSHESGSGATGERGVCLVLLSEEHGERAFPVDRDVTTIGRRPDRTIVIANARVSGRHAEVLRRGSGYVVRDLFSKNGTRVNGELVRERALRPGDRIEIGGVATLYLSDRPLGRRRSLAGASGLPASEAQTPAPAAEPGPPALAAPEVRIARAELEEASRGGRVLRAGDGLDERAVPTLFRLAEAFGTPTCAEKELLERALDLTLELLRADRASALLLEAPGVGAGALVPAATRARSGLPDEPVALSTALVDEVLGERGAVSAGAVMAAPLATRERVFGVLYISGPPAGGRFERAALLVLAALGRHLGLAVEGARLLDHLAERVAERAGDIEELSREREELLSLAADDLRTPLEGILGYLEYLLARIESDPAAARLAGEMSVAVEMARGVTELVAALERRKAGAARPEIAPEPTDLGQFLSGAAAVYERWAAAAGRRIEPAIADALPLVRIDRRRVTQIVNHLVHDALKKTPHGGRVRLEARALDAERVEVAVTDEGEPATPPGEGEGERERPALAVVRKLVQLHGGVLRVHGRPGGGARCAFTLPVRGPRGGATALAA